MAKSAIAPIPSKVILKKRVVAKAKTTAVPAPARKTVAKVAPKKAVPATKGLHKKSVATKKHSK
jgi:hypothetical protein